MRLLVTLAWSHYGGFSSTCSSAVSPAVKDEDSLLDLPEDRDSGGDSGGDSDEVSL